MRNAVDLLINYAQGLDQVSRVYIAQKAVDLLITLRVVKKTQNFDYTVRKTLLIC